MFSVYILYSETKSKYYVGQTNDLQNRLDRHNSAQVTSTIMVLRFFFGIAI